MGKFKGFIFDFNGVLWFDTHLQEKAWQDFATEIRGSPWTESEIEEHLHGRPNKHSISYLLGRDISDPEELDKLIQQKEGAYRKLCLAEGEKFKFSPGSIELLNWLKDNNVNRTIATASEITNLEFFFENLNLSNWFDINIVVYDDGTLPGKPNPDKFLKACKNIGLSPKQCVLAEDSKSGITAGVSAEIGFIIGMGPENKHNNLKERGANTTVRDFNELNYKELF